MAPSPEAITNDREHGIPTKGSSKRKLFLLAVPVLLGGTAAALWFGGIIPRFLGTQDAEPPSSQPGGLASQPHAKPFFVEIPEIVANLNSGARRTSYIKMKVQLEVASQPDVLGLQAAMPRVLDMFQTYIREMRPEEMRGSGGTYRLREELIARANLAAAPVRVRDVLFVEVLIQ